MLSFAGTQTIDGVTLVGAGEPLLGSLGVTAIMSKIGAKHLGVQKA